MCSFLITNITIKDIEDLIKLNKRLNFKLKLRGPDRTIVKKIKDITLIHNLLHITGVKTIQPFTNKDETIICVFNGEIYNYKKLEKMFKKEKIYKSDGECIIDLYLNYGETFTQYIHGEFAIVLIDLNKNKIIISSDVFATKPIYIRSDNDKFAISTYKYALNELGFQTKNNEEYKLEANTILCLNLNNYKFDFIGKVHEFKLTQHKNNFNDFNEVFLKTINMMAKHGHNNSEISEKEKKKIFITLSSGYDSGSLACALNKCNIDFGCLSSYAGENKKIIDERHKKLKLNKISEIESNIFNITRQDKLTTKMDILGKIDKFTAFLDIKKTKTYNILNDDATFGMAYLFNEARKKGYKIHLSGQGADEIFADYGFNGTRLKSHSCFGGKFPKDLKTIFPWYSFYKGTQECFINKEEHVAGCYGIENRYPFLDKNVVQEFLYLSPVLKNKFYKAPLYNFLKQNEFPFDLNKKSGFTC